LIDGISSVPSASAFFIKADVQICQNRKKLGLKITLLAGLLSNIKLILLKQKLKI